MKGICKERGWGMVEDSSSSLGHGRQDGDWDENDNETEVSRPLSPSLGETSIVESSSDNGTNGESGA